MTRKVTAGLFHSLNGVVSSPHQFQFDSFDQELGEVMERTLSTIDETLMGRVTYQEWAEYWPVHTDPEDYGAFINPIRKNVASRTLAEEELAWENSHLIPGDLFDFVSGLKERDGGDIGVQGSISVVRQLFLAGLLDELTLITHPVIAAEGVHLFGPEVPTARLELVEGTTTSAGNVVTTYRLRR